MKESLIDLQQIPILIITLPGQPRESITMRMLHTFSKARVVYSEKTDNYVIGCALGHERALDMAITEYPDEPVLILEDDADFTPWYRHNISVPKDAEVIYVGLSAWGWKSQACRMSHRTIDNDVSRIETMTATHAILYPTLSYKLYARHTAIQAKNTATPYDIPLAANMANHRVYALRAPLFYQNDDKNISNTLFKI